MALSLLFVLIAYIKPCISEYNLIDPSPSCVQTGLCSLYGSFEVIHPNAEERVWYLQRNMARLFPNDFLKHRMGARQYNNRGPPLYYNKWETLGCFSDLKDEMSKFIGSNMNLYDCHASCSKSSYAYWGMEGGSGNWPSWGSGNCYCGSSSLGTKDEIKSRFNYEWCKYRYNGMGLAGVVQLSTIENPNTCGVAASNPMYWMSEGNQACRFHQWSRANCCDNDKNICCTTSLDDVCIGISKETATSCTSSSCAPKSKTASHATCADHCSIFKDVTKTDCGYGNRVYAFLKAAQVDDKYSYGGEGVWGSSMGYTSNGHCGLIFNPEYDYLAFGVNGDGATQVGIKAKGNPPKKPNYPLVHGAHMDERTTSNTDANNKFKKSVDKQDIEGTITFMVQFYGTRIGESASHIYLVYDGKSHVMELEMGSTDSGFWWIRLDEPKSCKPYAFIAVTNKQSKYRLPENQNYFFGTAYREQWMTKTYPFPCKHNHYYYKNGGWKANGGPKVSGSGGCNGCSTLRSIENGINTGGGTITTKPTTTKSTSTTKLTTSKSTSTTKLTTVTTPAASCETVTLSGFATSTINGVWTKASDLSDDKPYYTKSGLYLFEKGHAFAVATAKGGGTYRALCSKSELDNALLAECTKGKWKYYNSGWKYDAPAALALPDGCGSVSDDDVNSLNCPVLHECVVINGLRTAEDGTWQAVDCDSDHKPIYKKSNTGDGYLCHDKLRNRWYISSGSCSYAKKTAMCTSKTGNIMQCLRWYAITANRYSQKRVVMSTCNNAAFTFTDDRDCQDMGYNEKICVLYGNNTSVQFEMLSKTKCSNLVTGKPVYYHDVDNETTHFIHYTIGKWMISNEMTESEAEIVCEKESLMDCIENEWNVKNVTMTEYDDEAMIMNGSYAIFSTMIRKVEYFVDPGMSVKNRGCNESEVHKSGGGNRGSVSTLAIVLVILFAILLTIIIGIVAFVWCNIKRRHNKAVQYNKETIDEESADDEEQQMEMNATLTNIN